MRSSFFGMDIGRKALAVAQAALDVTGHNVANANTPGYSRQVVNMQTTSPYRSANNNSHHPYIYMGTGVTITDVTRVREEFLDTQYRKENRTLGDWQAQQNALEKIEVILNEPSLSGIKTVLQEFWKSWDGLAKFAENPSLRAVVRQKGEAVANTFQHLHQQLVDLRTDLDATLKIKVDEVNSIAQEVADLNLQIVRGQAAGSAPNDLMDRRDLLVDQLSKLIDLRVVDNAGDYTIMVGGNALVSHNRVNQMAIQPNSERYADIIWAGNKQSVQVTGGAMHGLLVARDGSTKSRLDELDTLAQSIMDEVNAVHRGGYGLDGNAGRDFFVKAANASPAQGMMINADLAGDVGLRRIAAASKSPLDADNGEGDGGNALALSRLEKAKLTALGTTSTDYLQAMVAALGVDAQHASLMVENQESLVNQLTNQRDSVMGVNLDEEMTKMVQYQHSYNAAARVISAMDEMLDTLINQVGGR